MPIIACWNIFTWVPCVVLVIYCVLVCWGQWKEPGEVERCKVGAECGWLVGLWFDGEGGDCPELVGS